MGVIELATWYLWPLAGQTAGSWVSSLDALTRKATIVCATHNKCDALGAAVATWCSNEPSEIIIVADPTSFNYTRKQIASLDVKVPIKVLEAPKAHKRRQLCMGFQQTVTEVVVICDDDTFWTPGVLISLAQPLLANHKLGCVFPDLLVDPVGNAFTIWELLALLRLVGDGVDFHASRQIDGGVFCHHGSTAAYQGVILRDPHFIDAFTNETWRGHLLNSGDDQFLCRWLTNHDWPTKLLSSGQCLVRTRMRASWKHMLQLLRWSPNDWRACLSTLLYERHIWRYFFAFNGKPLQYGMN